MQIRMMYGKWENLQKQDFNPGTLYFVTDRREIWFDAPDLEERIQFTDSPEALDLYANGIHSRLDDIESKVGQTNI